MTLAAYTGHEALTFTDYLDLGTGKTLHAEPGGTYDVAPASGRLVGDIPQGWFTPLEDDGEDVPADSTEVAEVQVEPAETGGGEEVSGEPDEHSAF